MMLHNLAVGGFALTAKTSTLNMTTGDISLTSNTGTGDVIAITDTPGTAANCDSTLKQLIQLPLVVLTLPPTLLPLL